MNTQIQLGNCRCGLKLQLRCRMEWPHFVGYSHCRARFFWNFWKHDRDAEHYYGPTPIKEIL